MLLSWGLGRDVGGVQDELAAEDSITAWVVWLWWILGKGLEVRNLCLQSREEALGVLA